MRTGLCWTLLAVCGLAVPSGGVAQSAGGVAETVENPQTVDVQETADVQESLDFEAVMEILGGHGCTLSPESVEAIVATGTPRDALLGMTETAMNQGMARQMGGFVVFERPVCTIRLPQISSRYSVDHPEIRAAAPFTRDVYDLGGVETVDEGCFIADASEVFRRLEGGDPRAGFEAFMAFMGAGLIAGDVRFYEISPLKSPVGFQILTGPRCGDVANADDIARSHDFIESHFADFVRFVGDNTPCGEAITPMAGGFTADLQGFDMAVDLLDQPQINAWLWFEMMLVTMAAGWHDGLSDTDRGNWRTSAHHRYTNPTS